MRITRKALAGIGVAGALALASVPALAQDATETPDVPSEVEAFRDARHAEFAAALADELGLPVEEVEAALESVRADLQAARQEERLAALQERLDEAVAAGDLTQEEADAIIAAAEAGVLPFGRRGMRGHGGFGGFGPGVDGAGVGLRGPGLGLGTTA